MIILKETTNNQEFKFLPRKNTATSLVIKGVEGSNTYNFTPTFDSYYMVASGVFNLKENQQYSLTVLDESEVIYKDRIFCTNQAVDSYSINKNEYKETSSNNDFIII